jgi:hypothetical protein
MIFDCRYFVQYHVTYSKLGPEFQVKYHVTYSKLGPEFQVKYHAAQVRFLPEDVKFDKVPFFAAVLG